MKIKEILRKGSLIEILHEENNIFYQTNIKDLMEDALAIGVPASGQERLFMQEGTKWLCRIKIDSTFQYFSSTVVRRAARGKGLFYHISWPRAVSPYGRRKYHRYPCCFKVYYWALPANLVDIEEEKRVALREIVYQGGARDNGTIKSLTAPFAQPEEAVTADISGGGVLLNVSRRFPAGTGLLLQIALEGNGRRQNVLVKGRVVWSLPPQEKTAGTFGLALQFENMSKMVKREIVSFLSLIPGERQADP